MDVAHERANVPQRLGVAEVVDVRLDVAAPALAVAEVGGVDAAVRGIRIPGRVSMNVPLMNGVGT